jgi:hypothetical protein
MISFLDYEQNLDKTIDSSQELRKNVDAYNNLVRRVSYLKHLMPLNLTTFFGDIFGFFPARFQSEPHEILTVRAEKTSTICLDPALIISF